MSTIRTTFLLHSVTMKLVWIQVQVWIQAEMIQAAIQTMEAPHPLSHSADQNGTCQDQPHATDLHYLHRLRLHAHQNGSRPNQTTRLPGRLQWPQTPTLVGFKIGSAKLQVFITIDVASQPCRRRSISLFLRKER